MHLYDSKCKFRTNWSDLAGTPWHFFEHEPLNAFERIEAVLAATLEEEPLEASMWELSDVRSSWNTYWIDGARAGGGLDINDPVCGQCWTKYCGLHFSLFTDCDPEETWDCEVQDCVGAQSTVGHAAAAATTTKSLGIPLSVVVPRTPTPSELDTYNRHWQMCFILRHIKINGIPSSPGVARRPGRIDGDHRQRTRHYRL